GRRQKRLRSLPAIGETTGERSQDASSGNGREERENPPDDLMAKIERPMPLPAITTLGIIAGNRSLPLLLARQARSMGTERRVAVAFENETDPELAALVDKIVWVRVGQLSKLISAFADNGVRHCVMAGQIAPKNLFDLRPDLRAVALL